MPDRRRTFVPVHYKIQTHLTGHHYVNGYAWQLPAPLSGLRFCVRECNGEWVIDHFDSGLGVHGPLIEVGDQDRRRLAYVRRWRRDGATLERCARWLERYLRHQHRRGELRRVLEKNGCGWCADEAGL